MVLEIANELNKHNIKIEKAISRQRHLIEKVEYIEEKIMEKELTNWEIK